jgi:hypothetical protein
LHHRLSIDLYVEVLADDGDVAMMVIDRDGSIYRNENALKKLRAMWRQSFDSNVQTLVPIFSTHIRQKNLGVAGIQWLPAPPARNWRWGCPLAGWTARCRWGP